MAGLIANIADAVHHAHGAGLVHRDLKPANIMIDEKGNRAWPTSAWPLARLSRSDTAGEVAGTPAYMAPEQVRAEAHRLDRRTDVWALGVMLYQA